MKCFLSTVPVLALATIAAAQSPVPKPPQAPPLDVRVTALETRVAKLEAALTPKVEAAPAPKAVTYRTVCEGGVCRLVPVSAANPCPAGVCADCPCPSGSCPGSCGGVSQPAGGNLYDGSWPVSRLGTGWLGFGWFGPGTGRGLFGRR